MKTKPVKQLLILGLTIIAILSFRNIYSQSEVKVDHALKVLKEFYVNYIQIRSKNRSTALEKREIDSILIIYCTSKLIDDISYKTKSLELDFDPFWYTQYFEIEWLTTLNIKKDLKYPEIYYASYVKKNRLITIKLRIVKEKGCYKIDHIFYDDYREETIK